MRVPGISFENRCRTARFLAVAPLVIVGRIIVPGKFFGKGFDGFAQRVVLAKPGDAALASLK